jgi:hypothetical protein
MKISKINGLGSFGHYIDDVDFNTITDEEWIEIGKLHLQGLVTVIRSTNITKDQYYNRMQQFGPMKGARNSRAHFIAKYGPKFDAIVNISFAVYSKNFRFDLYLLNGVVVNGAKPIYPSICANI